MIQAALEMGDDDSDEDEADDVDEATELANKMRAAGLIKQPSSTSSATEPQDTPLPEDQKKN